MQTVLENRGGSAVVDTCYSGLRSKGDTNKLHRSKNALEPSLYFRLLVTVNRSMPRTCIGYLRCRAYVILAALASERSRVIGLLNQLKIAHAQRLGGKS